jgi:multiple sugar transport system substrate-binding protein
MQDMFITSSLSGRPHADVYNFEGPNNITNFIRGRTMPLEEYVPPNADVLNDQKYLRLYPQIMGQNVVFHYWTEFQAAGLYNDIICVNVDLIHEIGCEDPRDLYDAGNWTWDTFLEVCRAVMRASTPERELWALSGRHFSIMANLIVSNGAGIFDDVKMEMTIGSPETMVAINFYTSLLMDERAVFVFNENITNDSGHQFWFQTGDVAMFILVWWMVQNHNHPFEMGIVSFPQGPNYAGHSNLFGMTGLVIPKGVPDPGLVYQIVEEYNSWWEDDDSIWVTSRLDGLRNDFASDADARRFMEIGRSQPAYDLFLCFRPWILSDILRPVYAGELTPAQAVEANINVMQETVLEALGLTQAQTE